MEELNISIVAKKSIQGVFAFVSRSVVISFINFGRDIILAILLSAATYGIYFVVESLVAVLGYFSDIGLAGALIQKKEKITDEELQTTFTIQTAMVLLLVVIVLFFSPLISNFFRFPKEGTALLQAFVFAFFLSSLKTIPSVILERNLEFGKFVIPQVVETFFYTATVIFFAWKGFGVTSFTYAVLARGISGLIAIYIISPWNIGFRFSKSSLKHLLSFGIPFQANSILALIKDNLIILYLPRVLPLNQVGYIAFSMKWAFVPLRQVMDNIIRVTFSSFSRLQHDKDALGKAFEKSILAGTTLIFPALVGLVLVFPYVIHIIPKYAKWEPAYVSLLFFAINAALASILVPLTNLLNAIGKIKITLNFMILWTVITWICVPIAIHFMGYNGVALISAFINVSVWPIIIIARRYVHFQIKKAIVKPILSTVIMGMVLYLTSPVIVSNVPTLILEIGIGAIVYFGILYLIAKDDLRSDLLFIKNNLRG